MRTHILRRATSARLALLAFVILFFDLLATAQGGPPLLTDDPGTPGAGHMELNLGLTSEFRSGLKQWEAPIVDANYGWGNRIQLKYEVPWLVDTGSALGTSTALGDSKFGVKWRFMEHEKSLSISTYPQVSFNNFGQAARLGLVDRGKEFLIPVEAALEVGGVETVYEVGYSALQYRPDEWLFGAAAGREISKRLELLAEIHGTTERDLSHSSDLVVNAGSRAHLSQHIALLFSAGHGINNDSPRFISYAGVQITY